MKKAWLLYKVQLMSLLGLNKILKMKDKAERRKKLAGKIAIGLCLLCIVPTDVLYSYAMASGMQAMGALNAFPAVMLALTCMLTFLTTVPTSAGTLFGFRDYEQVMSLPVNNSAVAASRLMLVYTCNMLFGLLLLPAGGVYAYLAHPPFTFYPIFLVTWLFAPVVPMMLGCLLGALLHWATARLKGGKYVTMVLSMGLSLLIIFGSSSTATDDVMAMMGNFAMQLSSIAQRLYPLTGLYMRAVADLDLMCTLAFVLISAAVFALVCWFFGKNLRRINTAMNTSRARGHYKKRTLNASSPLRALYRREMKRYLSSPVYLMNTAFSLILAVILLVVLAFKAQGFLEAMTTELGPMTASDHLMLCGAAGLALSVFLGMTNTAACSLSMEGKQLWIIKTLPVRGFSVLLSKLLVNWTLTVPAALLFSGVLTAILGFSLPGTAVLFALPLLFALFFPMLGLLYNVKLNSFDWTNETVVVKQSASMTLAIFTGMLVPVGIGVGCFFLLDHLTLVITLLLAMLATADALCFLLIRSHADGWLRTLGDDSSARRAKRP